MGELKALGSEKLQGQEKINRILELTYYQDPNNSINNNGTTTKHEFVCESINGVFGIDKEKDGFYVKKGLNEDTMDYIGGMFMKNKNRFRSFGEAFKRLELLRAGELNEATKYVLKQSPAPAPAPAPVPAPSPESEESVPNNIEGDETVGSKDTTTDPIKKIQKTVGKLAQELRDAEDYLESEDLKSMFNSILSAVDVALLDDEDKEDILANFEQQDTEPEMDDDSDMMGDDAELDEVMDSVNGVINTPLEFDDDEFDFSKYEDADENDSFGEFDDEGSLEEEFDDEENIQDEENEQNDDEPFDVHGVYSVSNSGGYEIMISPDGDFAKVKEAYGTDNPKISDWLEIEYVDDDDTLDSIAVIDPSGYNIPLNQVMKVNKVKEPSKFDMNELEDYINKKVKSRLSELFK